MATVLSTTTTQSSSVIGSRFGWTVSNAWGSGAGFPWSGLGGNWILGAFFVTRQTVTTTRTDRLLAQEVIPYMRPAIISFQAEKLRPYSTVNVYFNGESVTNLVTSGTMTVNGITTDANGNCSGTFRLPGNRFPAGNGQFTLSDDPNPNEAVSYAASTFRSIGTIDTVQATIQTNISTESRVELMSYDPLAQTFFVNTRTQSPGCFITKIRLWFQSKDPKEPVEVEIRNVENGYPGREVIGRKVLPSASVAISANASLHTDFEFDRPVFLENNGQYCFVIKTNSIQYHAWIAEMGQIQIDKNEAIAKQPNAGVMFVSANDFTWSAVQGSDIKFQLFVAKFDPNATGTVYTVPSYPNLKSAFDTAAQVYSGTKSVRVFALNHGLQVGSKTRVAFESTETSIFGVALTDFNGVKTVTEVDSTGFKFNVSGAAVFSSSGFVQFDRIEYEPNAPVDIMLCMQDVTAMPGTNYQLEYKGVSGKSVDGTQSPFLVDASWSIIDNNLPTLFTAPQLIPSYTETQDRYAGTVQSQFKTTLSTSDAYISPFIKLESSGVVAFSNVINDPINTQEDFVAETSATLTGSVLSKYVTKAFGLNTPATALRIRFASNCVSDSNVDVYYRVVSVGDNSPVDSKAWVLFNPSKPFIKAADYATFNDYEFDKTGLVEFSQFQIKLVLRTKNSALSPVVKDLRILALAV